jgi:outer membrane protein assembly factor BamB
LLAILSCSASLSAAHWPSWRGPNADGTTSETDLPLKWDKETNVRWHVPLPDRGNSTPVIWGQKVFVTQAIEKENRRTLMCFDRANGKLLWQQGVVYPEKEVTHATNPQCSASPVTDGERVIVSFGSAGLYCYDLSGKELWKRELGKLVHIWGHAASPVLAGDLCYLNYGPGETTFLIALDKRTGKTVWQHDEPGGSSGNPVPGKENRDLWVGSWSDPIVRKIEGQEQLLMTYPKRICAFDPLTGKELWTCEGLNPLVYTSPIFSEGIVVGMGGFNGSAAAVKAGGSGDITSRRLWQHPKTKQRIGSGVIHESYVFIFNDPGVAECFELKTGKLIWEERVKGPAANGQNWSSFVLSGDRLYAVNQGGDGIVLRASPKFEVLGINPLGEKTIASIGVSDGELFIRTYQQLWCISGKKTVAAASR